MNAPAVFSPHAMADLSGTAVRDTRLTVPGMRCAGCIATIERGLIALDGVGEARVNLSARRVAVRHDERVDPEQLVTALRDLGFEAQVTGAARTGAGEPSGAEDGQMRGLLRALAVAGFGMMNVMLLSISVWSGAEGVTRDIFHWLSAMIALPVLAYSGRVFFASAARALRRGKTNMDVPISIGIALAAALSLYETATGGAHAYFDGVVMLLFFLLAGRALDEGMRGRTRAGIGALLSRMGRDAGVIRPDGSVRRMPAGDLKPGMVMLVAAGEALAADGVVESGTAMLDNAMLTGESAPEHAAPGTPAHAGAINMHGPIQVRITGTGDDTAIAEIARLMDEAGQSRSRYVRISERAARIYAPAVHTLAALAFAGWMIAGAGWHQSLTIAIAVLIITCPCAIGLAVPAAQVVATGALIRRGLLIKDGSALERLAEIDMVFLDKTGTLTLGELRADIAGLDTRAASIALALAQASRHPLSIGLSRALTDVGVVPAMVDAIVEREGEGVTGWHDGVFVALARPADGPRDGPRDGPPGGNEGPRVQLRIGDETHAIGFADRLRGDVEATLDALRAMNLVPRILSGDSRAAVDRVAQMLHLSGEGGATPAKKLAILNHAKAQGHRPLMVGDGLNDGPALAAAHAAIAPGTASDASQQAADAVFTGTRLFPVALAVATARRTMRIVRQNFALAICYNVAAVPLALMGQVTPLVAAIAMSSSSLLVVANALRLARVPAMPGMPSMPGGAAA
ncbi:heavy metal translocating P-type ATPase [Croceicoccus hydrothermalis]|uniref:heavy metal translocating P-type ATPase n=1 Tax=Croceicoccus hydrothermalis TaxID=2867964 RepID=UPI001EFB2014|nr:heavy metal translocating P-type ATPase [Croceicoccus hydrothermalis]